MTDLRISLQNRWRFGALRGQQGLGFISLFAFGIVAVSCAWLVTKILPTVTEFVAIERAVVRASQDGTDLSSIRASFERAAIIDDIQSIKSTDLRISRVPTGGYSVAFSYEKRIPLVGPATLLLEYHGESGR